MLLSKYSNGLRKRQDMVLKIASKTILEELEEINNQLDDEVLDNIYEQILNALNSCPYKEVGTDWSFGLVKKRSVIRQYSS